MPQSYKVFIGSSFILFGNEAENGLVFNRKFTDPTAEKLLELIQELELGNSLRILVEGSTAENWAIFNSYFKTIEAAGGLVQNENGEWLFIHRNGMWDLPKGKLEKGESIGECAVREVAEECGIEKPIIVRPLSTTYHSYKLKDQRILKPTYWFRMKSADTSTLIPQTDEGISEVKWIATKEAIKLAKDSFGSIKLVVAEGIH
ncbi:MAG: NUDIX domain-containing protein [Flavobacteriales bacterium]|nr:NUDIX domain-containing protein [Flavobacteriales bacterium]